ncbi:mitochondrial carrier domain-containing protein [Podospora fimiseda]|uniref:Mitochondrial glycine transporter n=1 Tax=Podospora fimiseda TaxID=252190 RepID=A0AAN7H328_9PEZI|nr:mitochondrial carrier domain-containing protein [Podospora fimiseda]
MSDGARKAPTKSTFHFVAGLGSGVLSAVLLQPIDLLKTRVQQQSGSHSLKAAITEIRTAKTGFWRGAVPSALRTGFGSAIYFTSLNAIRQSASTLSSAKSAHSTNPHSSSLPKLSNTSNLFAGAVARSFAGFLLMPLTVLKVRYESTLYSYSSLSSAAKDIFRREGVRGFFAGFGATTIRDAPYAGTYVLFYEQSKKHLSHLFPSVPEGEKHDNGKRKKMGVSRAASINFASGVLAGMVCSAVSNPFDAVKTRIQLQPDGYRNMVHAAKRMVGEEGFRSLWDGLALRMSRKAMSSALAWTLYEELIRRAEVTWTDGGKVRSSL